MENLSSSSAVVLWGLGGIGKSTVAKAVVSFIDRERHNFARVDLDSIYEGNNYTRMQQQILNDGFPMYKGGRIVDLRDTADGKDHIAKAFEDEGNKPVFLFIDNVPKIKELANVFPDDLSKWPKGTKILITTRTNDGTQDRGQVRPLSENDALTILCKDRVTGGSVAMKDGLKEIASLCGGIPLVLEIIRGRLRKQGYNPDHCTQIVRNMKEGGKIKENKLSYRLFDVVYNELEYSTQEAFLDICCFFCENWLRRHVEYIVGHEEVSFLADAAFISPDDKKMFDVHNLIRSIGLSRSKSSRICDEEAWDAAVDVEADMKEIKGISVENKSCIIEKRHLLWIKDKLRILSWRGSINVPTGIRLPQLRCIRTDGDVNWLNVEPKSLGFLECDKLPKKLPKSLRCLRVQRQPAEMQDLSEFPEVPDSCLEELSIEFQNGEKSFNEVIEESSYNKNEYTERAINRFLQNFKTLKHLESIKWSSLSEMPEQVCRSPQFSTLRMKSCYKLENLTDLFDQLKILRELCLDECPRLKKLPSSFGQLTNLSVLHLISCDSLKIFPPEFGHLPTLEQLCLENCTSLEELPSTFSELNIKWFT